MHFHRSIRWRDPSSSRERTRKRERVAPSHVDWPAPRIYKIRHDRAIHSILAKLSIPIVRGRSYIAAGADFEFRPATLARNSSRNWDRDRIFYSRNDDDTHEISIATLLFDFIAPVRRRRSDSRQSSSPRSHGTQWRRRFSVQPRKTSANFDDVVSSSFRFQSLHTRSQSSVHIYFQNGIQIYIYIYSGLESGTRMARWKKSECLISKVNLPRGLIKTLGSWANQPSARHPTPANVATLRYFFTCARNIG